MSTSSIKRRDFLRNVSLATVTTLPAVQAFAQLVGRNQSNIPPSSFINRAYRLTNFKNLLSLEFYFINVEESGKFLVKNRNSRNEQNSFMVIRLPQQHIAEEFFDEQAPEPGAPPSNVQHVCDFIEGNTIYAQTIISGYSYLAFQIIWGNLPSQKLSIDATGLLNWNASWFYLLVRKDLSSSIFEIINQDIAAPTENSYPMGHTANGNSFDFDREKFPKAFSSEVVLNRNTRPGLRSDAAPITAIEAPYGLIISPQRPDPEYDYEFLWSFSEPTGFINENVCLNRTAGSHYDELWMATLTVEKKKREPVTSPGEDKKAENPKSNLQEQKSDAGDDLMRLMLLGHKPRNLADGFMLLPDQPDKEELVRNYIQYRLTARTPKLTFTPLGISANINFLNKKFFQIVDYVARTGSGTMPKLYEWKQQISFGRDQEVMTSTVVMESCHGLKMLHIKSTKRQTYKGTAILVYREYLQPLDPAKDVTLYDSKNVNEYKDPCYPYNTPFKKIEFAEWDAKQIMPLFDMTDAEIVRDTDPENTPLAFWPHRPGRNNDIPVKEKRLRWKFKHTGHDGKEEIQEREIYIVTIDLAYGKNSYAHPFPEDETKLTINESVFADAQHTSLLGFSAFNNKLRLVTTGTETTWERVMRLAGDFDLQQLDHYRTYLTEQLNFIEGRLRSYAGFIEDEVIEKFQVFKQKALAIKSDLIETITDVKEQLRFFIERLAVPSVNAARNELNGLLAIIDELESKFEDNLKDLLRAGNTFVDDRRNLIVARINATLAAIVAPVGQLEQEIQKRKDQLQKTSDWLNSIPGILNNELERNYEEFVTSLPGKLRNNINQFLKDKFDDLHACLYQLRATENTLSGKIRFQKTKINYAVHKVEEDLEQLKQKIIAANPAIGWQKEYENVRAAYFAEMAKISELQTEFIVFRNNFRQKLVNEKEKYLEFFHEYACVAQMHTAKVCVKAVNDIVQKEVFVRIQYAQDYIKNQFSDALLDVKTNVSRVFAEIKAESKEMVKSAIRNIAQEMGGILNPDMAADFLTFAKDVRNRADDILNDAKKELNGAENYVKGQIDNFKNEINNAKDELNDQLRIYRDKYKDEILGVKNDLILLGKEAKENFAKYKGFAEVKAQEFFKGLEAKILGGIHLKDILGDGFELPKLDRKQNKIVYHFITDKIVERFDLKIVSFENAGKKAKLVVYFEKPLFNGDYVSWTALTNFNVGVFDDRVIIDFEKIQFYSDRNSRNKITVSMRNVHFKKELAFLESLSKNIKIPGTGLSLSITPKEIDVNFAYTLPGISGGAFTLTNLKFVVGVIIPLPIGPQKSVSPIIAKFGINDPDDKFVVAAGIWGGRGFFVIEATPKYIRRIDMGMDYGGYFGLSLGIAQGEAFLMAGIRYVFKRDEMGESGMEFYSIITCGGYVTVFGFITISVVFLLCLKYESYAGYSSLYGTASVTYSIKIGFFKKSFSLTFSKRLAGSDNPNASSAYRRHSPVYNEDQQLENGSQILQFSRYEEDYTDPESLKAKYDKQSWKIFCDSYSNFTTNSSEVSYG